MNKVDEREVEKSICLSYENKKVYCIWGKGDSERKTRGGVMEEPVGEKYETDSKTYSIADRKGNRSDRSRIKRRKEGRE